MLKIGFSGFNIKDPIAIQVQNHLFFILSNKPLSGQDGFDTDFALVEMNQNPVIGIPGTGIRYLGWTRSGEASTSGAFLGHPQGDVMKISTFGNSTSNNAPIVWTLCAYPLRQINSPANTHWTTTINDGALEGGSSGGPFFDQNGRVVGQLHGGILGCSPKVSYAGRFDVSWIGGGSDDTRLSTWLTNDPNVTQTNTIVIPSISGPSIVCSSNTTYTLNNRPTGTTVLWTKSNNLIYVSGDTTNNYIVKCSGGDPLPTALVSNENYGSSGWVSATIKSACGDSVVISKQVWVGLPAYTPIVTGSSTMYCSQSLYVEKYNRNATWSVYGPLQIVGPNYGHKCTVKGTGSGVGWVYATNSNLCGSFRGELLVQVNCSSYSVFPNPTNSIVTISLLTDNSIGSNFQKDNSIKAIRVVDKFGITLYTQKYGDDTFETKIDLSRFTTGVYVIMINEGSDEESYTIVKQ